MKYFFFFNLELGTWDALEIAPFQLHGVVEV